MLLSGSLGSFTGFKAHEFVAHAVKTNCVAVGPRSGQVLATGGDDKVRARPCIVGVFTGIASSASIVVRLPLIFLIETGAASDPLGMFVCGRMITFACTQKGRD